MTVAGRPRSSGERYPGGSLKPAGAAVTLGNLHRLRAVSRDPLLGTSIGRLLFLGSLTTREADAAFMVAEIYGRFHRAMGIRRSAPSPSYQRGFGIGERHDSADDHRRNQRAIRRFDELMERIEALDGDPASPTLRRRKGRLLKMLERVCVDDCAPEPLQLPRLKYALGTLARDMGLTR